MRPAARPKGGELPRRAGDLPRRRALRYNHGVRIDGSSAARAWLLCAAPFAASFGVPFAAPFAATFLMPFLGATARAQTDLGARLDEHLQRLVPWGLSGSVLVARNGRVVLAAGYGMADRGRGVSNTAQTQFPLGALGQQFTAIAVLQLVEQGRLALDDTLGARLDGVPEDKRAITLRQLLDHQSGLPDNVGDPLAAPESREDALARILGASLVFPPGSRAQESAAGYALLAAVVEKAAGIPFEQHLRASVLDRAGLSACLFAGDTRLERAPLARAMAEEREADSPARWPASWPLYGTGALFASVGDLYRFERALAPEVLLQPQSLEFFLDPPTGEWSGGMRVVLHELKEKLHLDVLTVAGKTLGELLDEPYNYPAWQQVIRPAAAPLQPVGALVVLRGNLAPDGSLLKRAAATPVLMNRTGRAVVFTSLADLAARIDSPDLDVTPDDFLVLQNAGPIGGPGMPEAGYLPIPKKLAGVKDMVRISDARMSGTAFGTVVLHVAPEAAVGGPLALVQTGDRIELSVDRRVLNLRVEERELARRREAWRPPVQPAVRGYLQLYQQHCQQAHLGADFDFLRGEPLGV